MDDYLETIDVVAVPIVAEEGADRAGSVGQIVEGLKQGHDAEEVLDSTLPLKQDDSEDVRGRASHADDIGSQRVVRELAEDTKGVDDLTDLRVVDNH